MHVKAVEAMIKSGEMPCNVKFMIEGEEEVGSENLGIFVKENVEKLKADVILVGVSRCGKTPISLYLAMQFGIKAANYPLIPEDFERGHLPSGLVPYRSKIFGLSIAPDRLSEVRNERRPGSKYASLENCRYEVNEAERMMQREGIRWVSTTVKSIEEIATMMLQELGLEKRAY